MYLHRTIRALSNYRGHSASKWRFRSIVSKCGAYTWLILLATTTIFPFFWMISTSFKPKPEVYYFRLLPIKPTIQNYVNVLTNWPFGAWFFNTAVATVLALCAQLLFCSLCGYALSKYKFPGRDIFFFIVLSTIMVPGEMLVIPWYVQAFALNIPDTLGGLLFPSMMGAFGVFVMRQAFINVPDEYIDAARVDGMSEIQIFFRIALPLVTGPLAALSVLVALGIWNDYFWPTIIMQSVDRYTIQLGMMYASVDAAAVTETYVDWGVVMTTTTIASIPMLILVILFQKYFVQGIALSGLKR